MEILLVYMLALLCCSSSCRGAFTASAANSTAAAVQVGFYTRTCPQAEAIVRAQVQKRFLIDQTITPALLRMLFHDSFVRGADASILLDSKPGQPAEKEALPNLTIRGFDLIDDVKEALEAACPGVVSCADIIVLAVRDSVALAGGPKYEVPTGRLDGKVSIKAESLNLPSPAFPVEQSQESFREKGLDLEDMVALLGAHTVGVALCGFFNDRLFNFHGTGAADPTMNPQLVTRLSNICPNPFFTESNADPPINLDQATPAIFDSAYFSQIIAGNGILQIDQEITADPSTSGLVQSFTTTTTFFPAFVRSIIKMGNIGVLTGANPLGEVRRKCNVTNSGVVRKSSPGGKSPPVAKPSPPGHVSKPPRTPISKPAPAGHVNKPPITPVTKPAPAGHVTKPPPPTQPPPSGHVTRPAPIGNVSRPAPERKPPSAGDTPKPAPGGHASKPAPVTSVTRPPPTGHVSKKPPPVTPVAKPAPPGHVNKPPVTKPTPVTPVAKPAPPGHGGEPPVTKPAPADHVTKPPAAASPPSHQVSKPTPAGHVSSPAPHIPMVKPAAIATSAHHM